MRRLICRWFGHRLMRQIVLLPTAGTFRYLFACERCNSPQGQTPPLRRAYDVEAQEECDAAHIPGDCALCGADNGT
jgi:hypothetical protein